MQSFFGVKPAEDIVYENDSYFLSDIKYGILLVCIGVINNNNDHSLPSDGNITSCI
jgi:hypothetical protein